MLIGFFLTLRSAGLKPGLGEFLTLLEGLKQHVALYDLNDFYLLARTVLVKDESHYDRYDRAFSAYFKGAETAFDSWAAQVPDEWLRREMEKLLTDAEKAQIAALGGFEQLMETLKQRLAEQKERHQGGNKWVGTGGTSPFGNSGFNPEGVRIGGEGGQKRAVKVWEQRNYRNLDDTVELGTRNLKVALRKLRRFARQGSADIFDLDGTIASTARNAGWLDIKMQPERHNAVKVLLFLDVGGSMDPHIKVCEELFSAARSEFKHLEHYYFHNFIYESVWRDNRRRHGERIPLFDVLRKYTPDYKLIFVGDATMGAYEILHPGGSVEHWNEEAGAVWFQRLLTAYPKTVWLNPEPEARWPHTQSIVATRELLGQDRMFPLTLAGMDLAIKRLSH